MCNQDLIKLFTPAPGRVPPYLAGREEERKYFQRCVSALKKKMPPPQNMVVYGPRGNGKTTLLRYLQNEALQKDASRLDIIWKTPDEIRTLTELSRHLSGDSTKIRDWFKSAAVSVSAGFVAGKTEVGSPRREPTIRELLQKRSQKKPLVLIIDEAHILQPDVGNALLNIGQSLNSEGYPFLLILAGTPNLRATLAKTDASFWERSEKIRLGRLSPDEAGQAVTVPLEQAGISFAPGVVDEIVGRAHCYPFFLQVWGDCIAQKLAQSGQTEITLDTVKEVDVTVTRKRDDMYQDRFAEIKRMGLLSAAESIANAFIQSDDPTLHEHTLEEAIAKGMAGQDEPVTDGRVMENLEQLSHLGYVWRAGGYDYEPGIPSLMTYIQGYSQVQDTASESSPLSERI